MIGEEPPRMPLSTENAALSVPGLDPQRISALTTLIGRNDGDLRPDIDLSGTSDAARTVSRRHAEIQWVDGKLFVVDLSSRVGTWVDKKRLEPGAPVQIREGSVVRFGQVEAKVVRL